MRDDWERLFFANPYHSPFLAWGWMYSWLEHLAGPHELFVLTLWDDEKVLQAIVPLLFRKPGKRSPQIFNICGYGPDCSDHLGTLHLPAYDARVHEIIADAIQRNVQKNCRLELNSLDSFQGAPKRLRTALRLRGRMSRMPEQHVCPKVQLPRTWEEFMSQLSSNFRSQVRRSYRRVANDENLEFRSLNESGSRQFAVDLIKLNRARMRDLGITSSLENEQFREFLVDSVRYMATKNIAWMDTVKQENRTVGAALNFVHGNAIYYYMGGFCEEAKKIGPGNALFAHVIQRGISQQYKIYDFLRGAENYKYRWGAMDFADERLIVYPSGQLRGGAAWTADIYKRIANRLLR